MPRRRPVRDLLGQTFGRLTVLRRSRNRQHQACWTCRCECGKKRVVLGNSLTQGMTRSCGCLRRETARALVIHGSSKNRLYRIWRGVVSRAPVVDARVLAIYRGPGTRDPSWSSFQAFADWAIAKGYAPHLTIDRIDNAGGYWPDNCRWATMQAQAQNKTNCVYLEIGGERLTSAEAARRHGLSASTVRTRIHAGWSPKDAVRKLDKAQFAEMTAHYSSLAG